jgi:hypothetical protein
MRAARNIADAFGVLVLFLLAGCASFPGPGSQSDSLFMLYSENPRHAASTPETGIDEVRFKGPSSFTIRMSGEEKRGYWIRVKPGRYTVEIPGPFAGYAGAPLAAFDVPPGTIVLFPLKITRVNAHRLSRVRLLVPLSPEDQRNAAVLLADSIAYEEWFGRASEGFGAYPPRLGEEEGTVAVDVAASLPGAQVTIDHERWGTAPVTATLRPGKHLLQMEVPETASRRQFVDVQGKGEMTIPLAPGEKGEMTSKVMVLLTAFQNMGPAENDTLRPFFSQAIGAELRDDERLFVIESTDASAAAPAGQAAPDFTTADAKGIDLVIRGSYTARQDSLLVYAALYDVQSEMAIASTLYTGKVGLAMFDSIDDMVARFIMSVDAALRERSARAAARAAPVDARMVAYQRERAERDLVGNRQAMKDSLALVIGPSWSGVPMLRMPSGFATLSAVMPLGLHYDHSFGGPFSLAASIQPAVAFENNASTGVDYASQPFLDIPLRVGPAYTLFGPGADLSFALQAEGRFLQAWFDNGTGGNDYKALWIVGLGIQTSARLYLQTRRSETPSFILLGFTWFVMGMQTEADFTRPHIIPMELSFLVGLGRRL